MSADNSPRGPAAAFAADVYRVFEDYVFDMLEALEPKVRALAALPDPAAPRLLAAIDALAARLQDAYDPPFDRFRARSEALFPAAAELPSFCAPALNSSVDARIFAEQRAQFDALSADLAALTAEKAAAAKALANKTALAASLRAALASVRELNAFAEGALNGVPLPAAIGAVTERIAALERAVAELTDKTAVITASVPLSINHNFPNAV